MRVAVDIDNCLYEWDATARHMLRRYLNETGKSEIPGLTVPSTHWNYIHEQVGNEAWEWLWSYGVEQGLFRNGHIIKGALDSLRILCERHDVILVTSRPKNAIMDTLEWVAFMLRGCKISGVHVLHSGEKKTTVPWDVLIDDGVHNAVDAVYAGKEVLLFTQPWNAQFDVGEQLGPLAVRVYGWGDVLEVL